MIMVVTWVIFQMIAGVISSGYDGWYPVHHSYQEAAPPEYPQPQPQHVRETPRDIMVDLINNLGLKLLAIHNENNENNIALSPYGALSVLVALGEGVRGPAVHEIIHATNVPEDIAVVRVGLRDIHRHLKSYFIPREGFLGGLTFNNDNVSLNAEYEDILRFYGYDVEAFNSALYPEPSTTEKPETTTEIIERDEPNESTTVAISTTMSTTDTERTSRIDETTTQAMTTEITETTTNSGVTSTVKETTTEAGTTSITTIGSTTTETTAARVTKAISTTELVPETTVIPPVTEASTNAQTEAVTTTVAPSIITDATSTISDDTSTILTTTDIFEEITTEIPNKQDPILEATLSSVVDYPDATTDNFGVDAVTSVNPLDSPTEIPAAFNEDYTFYQDTETGVDSTTTFDRTNEIDGVPLDNNSSFGNNLIRNSRSAITVENPFYTFPYIHANRPKEPGPEDPYKKEAYSPFSILNTRFMRQTKIDYMKYDTVLPFLYVPHLDALALSFPLDSSKYYLLLLLPVQQKGIEQLICELRLHGNLRFIIENLRYTHVVATIPSFMLKGYVNLTPTLQQLGIRKVFEPRQADFSPMTSQKDIYVKNIEQAVTVNIRNYVDPTLIEPYRNLHQYDPVQFKADHPFLYFVIDSELHVTLMAGKIVNPLNARII